MENVGVRPDGLDRVAQVFILKSLVSAFRHSTAEQLQFCSCTILILQNSQSRQIKILSFAVNMDISTWENASVSLYSTETAAIMWECKCFAF